LRSKKNKKKIKKALSKNLKRKLKKEVQVKKGKKEKSSQRFLNNKLVNYKIKSSSNKAKENNS